jgi:NADH-quinone oxidoreductase subunit G
MVRKDGKLKLVTWEEAFETIGKRFKEVKEKQGGAGIGVIGSNRTTNEENYLLQKFARTVLGTNNIDHHRTADYPAFAAAISGKPELAASLRDVETAPVILLVGNDPTEQHPLLATCIRNNVRLHGGKLFIVNDKDIKLKRQAKGYAKIAAGSYGKFIAYLGGNGDAGSLGGDKAAIDTMRDALRKAAADAGDQVLIIFGAEVRGADVAALVKVGMSHKGAKFMCLGDYANSRGAADMGLYPDLLPGYTPVADAGKFSEYGAIPAPGMDMAQMIEAAKSGKLGALYVVGANPAAEFNIQPGQLKAFLVVQEMFLTETASMADVVLPAANAYEKAGTVTNTYGDMQLLKKAGDFAGCKSDFELIVRIADRMGHEVQSLVPFSGGLRADMGQSRGAQSGEADRHEVWLIAQNIEPKLSPFDPAAMLDEIQRLVPGYTFSRLNLMAGNDVHTHACGMGAGAAQKPESIMPANDSLFSSGTLGRYSNTLNSVMENRNVQRPESEVMAD